jgi:hypothetical protein
MPLPKVKSLPLISEDIRKNADKVFRLNVVHFNSRHPHRIEVQRHYDMLYKAMRAAKITEFTADKFVREKLSSIFGPKLVAKALS